MIKSTDGISFKRSGGEIGDRMPNVGVRRIRATYTATGGETSINTSTLSPAIQYNPGQNQLEIKRSSGGALIAGLDYFETGSNTIGFPSNDALIAGEVIEITQAVTLTGVAALSSNPSTYSALGTSGQTLVTCSFSWQYNLNPSYAQGAVLVYVNGSLLSRNQDYTEVNLSATNTNQIMLTTALIGGENIVMVPAFQTVDVSSATNTFVSQQQQQIQAGLQAGFQGFISNSYISVPNTTITNRAQIPNLAADLKASFGVERIMTQSIYQLQNEVGPAGQPVWATPNDQFGLIRFVGSWNQGVTPAGATIWPSTGSTAYCEVTFYGTGLNILANTIGTSDVVTPYIDGTIQSNITFPATSTVIAARNYAANEVLNIVSGLSLGIHTVKLLWVTGNNFNYSGFEVINANSTTNLNINYGNAYINGQAYTPSVTQNIAYNSAVGSNTKGGRVVTYLTSTGTVAQAFTAVPSSPSFLASASHANEEPVRTYEWREFGAGRYNATYASEDDFSLLTSTSRNAGFTLEDGTTSLVGSAVLSGSINGYDSLGWNAAGSSITLTFVGTGLDILMQTNAFATWTIPVSVDGTSQGNLPYNATGSYWYAIASGLPYGSHTVSFTLSGSGTGNPGINAFKVYQPKTPSIPSGAIQLQSYNVMATYAANTTAGASTVGAGILRKSSLREFVYTGSGWTLDTNLGSVAGWRTMNETALSVASCTFFGTGFEFRFSTPTVSSTATLAVDGSTNLSSFTTGSYGNVTSFVASTGVITSNGTGSYGNGVKVSGLTLGLHTVTFTVNSTLTSYWGIEALDIITPIHSVRSNIYTDLQNTLPIGSCSFSDDRLFTPIAQALPAQKAWAQAVAVAVTPSTTSTTSIPMPDMSCSVRTSGGALKLSFVTQVYIGSIANAYFQFYVDGVPVGVNIAYYQSTAGGLTVVSNSAIIPVAAGVHKVDVYWYTSSGTLTAYGTGRILTVEEK